MDKRILLALLLVLCLALAAAAGVMLDMAANPMLAEPPRDYPLLITEICTKNETVIPDNQGKYRDYIEIYNTAGEEINLAGCRLTDGNVTSRPLGDLYIPAGG